MIVPSQLPRETVQQGEMQESRDSSSMMVGAMRLVDSDFQIFQLPQQFSLSLDAIDAAWKRLQAAYHPDQFVQAGAAQKRESMQWSVRINQARQRLIHPVRRAAYLCELQGYRTQDERNTQMPMDFLLQQMQWREEWQDLRGEGVALQQAFAHKIATQRSAQVQSLATILDTDRDYEKAWQQVQEVQFLDKFIADIDADMDRLMDA